MTLLFIHGAGFTGAAFEQQLRAFPNAHAPNLPGHDAPGSPETIDDFAEFVAHYVTEHALKQVVLCGHSMGGAVALQAVLRGLVIPRALVLLASGARLRVAPAFLEGLASDFEGTARSLAESMFAQPDGSRIEAAMESMRTVGQSQTLRDFAACNAFDALDRLEGISSPLLAVTGDQDRMTPPKYAQILAGRVPGGQARIIPGAGHLVMVEQPEETNAVLRAFVDRTYV